MGHRFFDLGVLAGMDGINQHAAVPTIRRSDDYFVNIFWSRFRPRGALAIWLEHVGYSDDRVPLE